MFIQNIRESYPKQRYLIGLKAISLINELASSSVDLQPGIYIRPIFYFSYLKNMLFYVLWLFYLKTSMPNSTPSVKTVDSDVPEHHFFPMVPK